MRNSCKFSAPPEISTISKAVTLYNTCEDLVMFLIRRRAL